MKGLILILGLGLVGLALGFTKGDTIPIYTNHIRPLKNPSETYRYYQLPFCKEGTKDAWDEVDFGERLHGDHFVMSPYQIPYAESFPMKKLCTRTLTQKGIHKFIRAMLDDYLYEMYFDDLPFWGYVGVCDKAKAFQVNPECLLYTDLTFKIMYNPEENRVIHINVTGSQGVWLRRDMQEKEVEFKYEASWIKTDIKYDDRMLLYQDELSTPVGKHIMWFGIFNSFALTLLCLGVLYLVLQSTLKEDYQNYAKDDLEIGEEEEKGWRLISGEVFRLPKYPGLLSSFLGNGVQLIVVAVGVAVLSPFGILDPFSGKLYSAVLVLFAVSSVVGGTVGAFMYRQYGGRAWAWNIIATACIFALPVGAMALVIDFVAIAYESLQAVPFSVIASVGSLWVFVALPLHIVGGIAGRRLAGRFRAPVRTNPIPRPIPPKTWKYKSPTQILLAGFFPFCAIFVQLHFIYNSFWGDMRFPKYGVLFLMAILLAVTTAAIAVTFVYIQLAAEDYRWWWMSFLFGSSVSLYVLLWSAWFFTKAGMEGALQFSVYYAYCLTISYAAFLSFGAIGHFASRIFVKRIYRFVKVD